MVGGGVERALIMAMFRICLDMLCHESEMSRESLQIDEEGPEQERHDEGKCQRSTRLSVKLAVGGPERSGSTGMSWGQEMRQIDDRQATGSAGDISDTQTLPMPGL